MPSYSQTQRTNADVQGCIFADAIYDAAGVMRAIGIGDEKLMELRKSGRLPTLRLDGMGRNLFRGADIIALLTEYETFSTQGRRVGA